MKKLFTLTLAIIMIFAFTITVFADVPAKKTQIDWLISGAGGDVEALGGNPANAGGEFRYDFTNEDGSLMGTVGSRNGRIWIYERDENGDHIDREEGDPDAGIVFEFANKFTQHFATLPREGHFHASHRLSAKSTEEFPIYLGSSEFITFCYDADADGGMMNAMEFDGIIKLVFNLTHFPSDTHSHYDIEHQDCEDDVCDDDHHVCDDDCDDCDDDHHVCDDDCDHDHEHDSHAHGGAHAHVPNPAADYNSPTGASASLLLPAILASAGAFVCRKRKDK